VYIPAALLGAPRWIRLNEGYASARKLSAQQFKKPRIFEPERVTI